MAANEILVKRYEDVVAEVKKREDDIEGLYSGFVKKVKDEKLLEAIGMPEEEIKLIDDQIEKAENDGCASIMRNKTNLWAMQLELYKDICDQLDSIRAEIAELKS